MSFRIMIVDDNISNLIMAQKTLEEEFEVLPVSSGLSALECLSDMPELPDLVVLDIDMPNVNGFQVISEMKNDRRLRNIPAIFLTAQDDATTELESYNLGAMDYIHKPYTASLLKKRINIQIQLLDQKRKLEDINEYLKNVIEGQRTKDDIVQSTIADMLFDLIGQRNVLLSAHGKRMEQYMILMMGEILKSNQYEFTERQAKLMCSAARIHDVGKLGMKDLYILPFKTSSHDKYDREVFKMHTIIGANAVKKLMPREELNTDFAQYAYNMCRYHHERFDGTGYPEGIKGEEIPLEARILSVIHAYDNFRQHQKDGKNMTHMEAMSKISELSGIFFDSKIVRLWMKVEKEVGILIP